jgi:hypothetical protein
LSLAKTALAVPVSFAQDLKAPSLSNKAIRYCG